MNWNDIFNNGIAIACLIWFMYVTNTTLKEVNEALKQNTQVIAELKEEIRGKIQ